MKIKYLFVACSVFAFASLSTGVANAEATQAAAAAENKSMKVFIVTAKGGGWGAGRAVRAAISSQQGVDTFKMSGLRTTVFMKDGARLEESKLVDAFSKGPVKFVSLEEVEQAVSEVSYMLMVKGATWAVENDKARAALEKLPNIAAVYVNKTVEVQLTADEPLDEKTITDTLAKYKIKVQSVQKAEL